MSRYRVRVTSGTGPVEVRELVALIGRRLVARVAEVGLRLVVTEAHGDAAAPRSLDLVVIGDAPRLLAEEIGTHVLVASSRRRGHQSRKRWFAAVSLHAVDAVATEGVDPKDLVMRAVRSRGPGGQNVNRRATAVEIRHIPSGVVVRAEGERSQWQNRRQAVVRIGTRLTEQATVARRSRIAAMRQDHYQVERGRPVRRYRLDHQGELIELLARAQPANQHSIYYFEIVAPRDDFRK